MLSSLVKTYGKNFMETITVIHSAFESEPQTVATLDVDKKLTDIEKCELAFRLTNSISDAWYIRDDVNYLGSKKTCQTKYHLYHHLLNPIYIDNQSNRHLQWTL